MSTGTEVWKRKPRMADQADTEVGEGIGFKPLYAQVRERLMRRLVRRRMVPGMLLPSEIELARQLSVSQGTVRKALDSMTADNLRDSPSGPRHLCRRTGREPDPVPVLPADAGQGREASFPDSRVISTGHAMPTPTEKPKSWACRGRAGVPHRTHSLMLSDQPILIETITLPASRFPDFDHLTIIPNNLYRLYSERWGITIGSAEERLKAIAASARDASQSLAATKAKPLLLISRVARDLEERPVELRWSRCISRDIHYAVNLR
jgi:GntR family transcriptional regulator